MVPTSGTEVRTTFRKNHIGYVFQFFNLLQDLTVLENILLIQELSGARIRTGPERSSTLLAFRRRLNGSLLRSVVVSKA